MRKASLVLILLSLALAAAAQTAEELVAKNLAAKGGVEKIKAIKSLRMAGRYTEASGFTAQVGSEAKAPHLLRNTLTLQGMSNIEAYDGATGWRISPFEGRKDPELMGEDDLRSMEEAADFYGPLVDAKQKGNTIEYLGMATVDGDGAYKLKVTLKNGDIVYYYLDPETFLEFRSERQQFIRGSVREQFVEYGSYKPVAGVYMPFTMSYARRKDMSNASTVNLASIEANVPIDDGVFKMPAAPSLASPQKQPDPPAQQPQKKKEKTEPPKPPPH